MPAALPALENGLIHEFPSRSEGPCLFLDDVWPIIEKQWDEVASVMTAIGFLFKEKMVSG